MRLTKGGITVEITYPGEIRRYKALGFAEVKPVPVAPADFAAQQQQIVEDALQPTKKKSAGATPAEKDTE